MSKTAKKHDSQGPVVVMRNAGKKFGNRIAVSDLNLSVSRGEIVGIIGPNGGGKSTALLLMAGLLRPTSGQVSVCGIEANALSLTSAGLIGLVTARPGLYPLLTGRENLRHFGGLFGLTSGEVDSRAAPLIRTLELTAGFDEPAGLASTGMQQKLSLIRALLLSPDLLLFDEPTANIDPLTSRILYTELRERADKGLACVLVTHDLSAAEAICDRVVIIDVKIKRELRFTERRTPLEGPLLAAWKETVVAQ